MTKVCIFGAGAIGGFLGTKLAASGIRVNAVARGATQLALREHGWRLTTQQGQVQAPAGTVSESTAELGVQDIVFIAVKGPALPALAGEISPLIGPETLVVPAMNGVPWWFCHGVVGYGASLRSVDPEGEIARAIPLEQVLGCVVHASTSVSEPGVVQHRMGQGLIIGEPRGGESDRAQRVVAMLAGAGFDATFSKNVRYEIWYKLWGNMTMNPVSAMTGATADRILSDPLVRDFCSAAMAEAQLIGARIGCAIDQTPEARHQVTAKLGAFRTSMLQDVDAGRSIELDAIVGSVREIGRQLAIPTPNIDVLYGLTRVFGQVRGVYPT